MLLVSATSISPLAQDESSPSATTIRDEERATASKLAQIDLPGTDDPELVEIAGAVLDDHGMVIPVRRLSCSQWEAYKAALEHKVAAQPTAFAYWLLSSVSQECIGTT